MTPLDGGRGLGVFTQIKPVPLDGEAIFSAHPLSYQLRQQRVAGHVPDLAQREQSAGNTVGKTGPQRLARGLEQQQSVFQRYRRLNGL
ncbi:hypothetical protein D3C85_1707580 [compost metagenome]